MIRNMIESIKAWMRKDKRIAPKGCYGRVYCKKEDFKESNAIEAVAKPEVILDITVTRATGEIEHYQVPGERVIG